MELETLLASGKHVLQESPLKPHPQELHTFIHDVDVLQGKCKKALHVVFVGAVKAGKSSLMNALAGEKVSPVGTLETTAAITRVRYGEEKKAQILFWQGESYTSDLGSILMELEQHRGDVDYFRKVKEVDIQYPLSVLKQMDFVDTPGLNTLTTQCEEITMNYLQEADVIFFVMNARYLGKASVEEDLGNLARLGKKLVCVISHTDEPQIDGARAVKMIERRYGDYFAQVFSFGAGDGSGLEQIRLYIEKNLGENAIVVQNETLLDSLQAIMHKDIQLHEERFQTLQLHMKLCRDMEEDLKNQSRAIQQEFRRQYQRWVDYELLEDASIALKRKIDDKEFSLTGNLEKEMQQEWGKVFDSKAIQKEVQYFLTESEDRIQAAWQEALEQVSKKFGARLQQVQSTLSSEQIQIGALAEEGNTALETVGISTAISAVLGTGASAYAAGLGTYAAHLSMAGALGSFMVPALVVGVGVGAVKSWLDFNTEREKLKDKVQENVHNIRRQLLFSGQKAYENNVADICQQMIAAVRAHTLQAAFQVSTWEEVDEVSSQLAHHLTQLRNFLRQVPSYTEVSRELSKSLQIMTQNLAKVRAQLEDISDEEERFRRMEETYMAPEAQTMILQEEHYQELCQQFRQRFMHFDEESIGWLASAEILYRLFQEQPVAGMDYSPVVIQYGKCYEHLLRQVLKHRGFVNDTQGLTIYDMLNKYINSDSYSMYWENGFGYLGESVRQYRNRSAHPAGMMGAEVEQIRTILLGERRTTFKHGILTYMNSLLD